MQSAHRDRELSTLVPPALLSDISCYILSDEHPVDQRQFDVVVCTRKGEVIELSRRQVVTSTCISKGLVPRDIFIFRTSEISRFYLVSVFEGLYIISTKGKLIIHKHFNNVDRFAVSDPYCDGSAHLQVWCNEDAVAIVLDDNFDNDIVNEGIRKHERDESTFVSSLKSKLIEAKHTVAINRSRYKQLLKLRQDAIHAVLQDVCPNPMETAFKSCQKVHEAITVESLTLWLRVCNGLVVLGVHLINNTLSGSFSNIKFILQSNTDSPIYYHTHMYSRAIFAPFWQKKHDNSVGPNCEAAVVAVTDLEEFAQDNKVTYSGVLVYEMNGREKIVPLRQITLSCLETLSESFDLLSSRNLDDSGFIAILATTNDVRLKLYHISTHEHTRTDLISTFQSHMKMETVSNTDNVLIHRKSPYHILNGVLIIIENCDETELRDLYATVYLRHKTQLTSLLHLIYDGVPHRLLITTPDVTVTDKRNSEVMSKKTNIIQDSMEVDDILMSLVEPSEENLIRFSISLSSQLRLVLEYFDLCMTSMLEGKAKDNVIGAKIDVIAPGTRRYDEFTRKLNEEIKRGFVFMKI